MLINAYLICTYFNAYLKLVKYRGMLRYLNQSRAGEYAHEGSNFVCVYNSNPSRKKNLLQLNSYSLFTLCDSKPSWQGLPNIAPDVPGSSPAR